MFAIPTQCDCHTKVVRRIQRNVNILAAAVAFANSACQCTTAKITVSKGHQVDRTVITARRRIQITGIVVGCTDRQLRGVGTQCHGISSLVSAP